MTRPTLNPIPHQIKHLRFVDKNAAEGEGEILNLGGYTLAYRVIDLSRTMDANLAAEWETQVGFIVQFAYAECHQNDNYNKKSGRNRARARLDHMAPGWSHTFLLENFEVPDEDVIRLNEDGSLVDFRGFEAHLSRSVVEAFCDEMQPMLNICNDDDPVQGFLIEHNGFIAIDSDALLVSIDGDDEEDEDAGYGAEVADRPLPGQSHLRCGYGAPAAPGWRPPTRSRPNCMSREGRALRCRGLSARRACLRRRRHAGNQEAEFRCWRPRRGARPPQCGRPSA